MNKQYETSLFIFRRDLRIADNLGLLRAMKMSKRVLPCVIFDPRQTTKHEYFSEKGFLFFLEAVRELQTTIKNCGGRLLMLEGIAHEVIHHLKSKVAFDAIFYNEDYTPFSQERDELITEVAHTLGVAFHACRDTLLHRPGLVRKQDNTPYMVYTPYMKKAMTIEIAKPAENNQWNWFVEETPFLLHKETFLQQQTKRFAHPRQAALKVLKNLSLFSNYENERNFPILDATTRLSVQNKFGTISIREFYHAVKEQLGIDHPLIRELFWRDFFVQVGYFHPHVLGQPFRNKFGGLAWKEDETSFTKWCEGKTGFPIVDAGMRELNQSGYMHNRVRMITASFLVKDLQIDWRSGEKYFANHLMDYDPLVNNGNWQWAASTGCDAQPWFRIFNPFTQQKKFDKDCLYIKKWLPELKDFSPKEIHNHEKNPLKGYPAPMVDHKTAREETLKMYGMAK